LASSRILCASSTSVHSTCFMGHSQLYERIIGGTVDRLVRLAPCGAVLLIK
jgi:hypothetical protein